MKKCHEEKVYILPNDVNTERKFEIKARNEIRPEKGLFLGAP